MAACSEASAVRRTVPELDGRDAFITEQLEQQYRTLLSRHRRRAVDERSQTHLQAAGTFCGLAAPPLQGCCRADLNQVAVQVACLLMATNKVLQPFVRDRLVSTIRLWLRHMI